MMQIPYTLIRSNRKTLSLVIRPSGEVEIRCPRRCSRQEAEQFLFSREAWIRKHLEAIAAKPQLPVFTQEELADLVQRAKETLPDRARLFANKIGVSYGRITIRSQRTRWGSCSASGNLNFNCLLMLCPADVRDYVVIHELCHRKKMNHSAQFWTEVERACPDYRNCRTWLKENGSALIARLPEK